MKKGILVLIAITAMLALGFTAQDAMAEGSVAGAVFDADGNGVEGAHVSLMQTGVGRGERPYRVRTETDERGAFGFDEVPAGNYVVGSMTHELGGARAEIEVVDDEVTRVRLVLEGRQQEEDPEVGVVVGVVETPDGNGVAVARVILNPMRRGRMRPMTTETDRQGNFVFQEVPEGMYMAQAVVRGGFAMARVEVVADQRNRVTLVLRRIGERGGDDDDRGERRRERRERFE